MKIDIHNHYIPEEFIAEARAGKALDDVRIEMREGREWVIHPQGFQYPLSAEFFDREAKLRHMDGLGIDISLLSVAPTLFFHWADPGATREFCQRTNEELARFVKDEARFYGMAIVPLQTPEEAAQELRRAVEELGLRGVHIGTTMEHIPLDDERFDPFFETASDLNQPVAIHPYYVGLKAELADFYLTNLIGNPLETTIAAARMILSGCLDRHPKLKVFLMHGGGFLPYQVGRLDHGFKVRKETSAHVQAPPSSYLRRFYFDTITHTALPLKFLVELVGPDRVVLGTDIPFDMEDVKFEEYFVEAGLGEEQLELIREGNAKRIFGLG